MRCIEHGIRLPGLYTNSSAPVCKTCIRQIKSSPLFHEISSTGKNRTRTGTIDEKKI